MLEDILEDEVDGKYYLSEKNLEALRRHLERNKEKGNRFGKDIKERDEKGNAVRVGGRGMYDLVKVRQLNPSTESGGRQPYQQNRVYDPAGKCPALMAAMSCGGPAVLRLAKNLRSRGGKAYALLASVHKGNQANGMSLVKDGLLVRRLTPAECTRLQTIPEWYKWGCSETQQYKMLGNGWTVDVIKHILSFMEI